MSAEVESGVGYGVKRVQQALRRRCDAALRPTGLSMSQYAVLRALADHPDASGAELARLCFVTRQSLQGVLSDLRAARWVDDSPTQMPGRARALALTPAGRRRLGAAHSAVLAVEDEMLAGLTARARIQLARLLARCADNLEGRCD
ncbi:MarR family transcriptional regulator [Mycobacterium sp. PS03-16]|uniref:MarR family winged helix-turn-helix transcriptional regulator n=1 Tax=Mycobacterium sp. PS03-16 TaxID=2559611 RepID=UPI00107314B3|nr:MarR family winged helix-turn-helix transcriptional regulator [Mycobacterium sp. PS03-16]TFV60393.1 MarR family transcriptional regulator [Mycobacterium sp. PS03-16]